MKLFTITAALFLSLFTTTSFANDGVATPDGVLRSFQTTFAHAKNADWTFAEEHYKVRFALDGQQVTAYYKADGLLVALTRNISAAQLPVSLQTTLKNDYKNYWVAGLFELSKQDGIQYYVTLEDADTKLVLKSSAATWNFYQKERKN